MYTKYEFYSLVFTRAGLCFVYVLRLTTIYKNSIIGNAVIIFTSAFRKHFYDVTYVAYAHRVYGLHGYRVFGTTFQTVYCVREPIGVNVHTLLLFISSVVVKHVGCSYCVRMFDRLPLNPNGAGRYWVHAELWRRWRVEYVKRVRYLIPAEYVLHVARIVSRVCFVVHGTH